MRTEDMDEATVRELFNRFNHLYLEAATSKLPPEVRDAWAVALFLGYLQTEHGLFHPSGVDSSGWREDAASHGLEVPDFDKAEREKTLRRYAEVMPPGIADAALADAKGGE